MSLKIEASGRRSVQVEVQVQGTLEDVWQAIATGPGISAWFVPTQFEVRDGLPVALSLNFGPDMVSTSNVTAWAPPNHWAAQSAGWAPGSPLIANEWSVVAHNNGTCTVRVTHSLVAQTDEWDHQLVGTESGWPAFFRTLQLYLKHFRGQPSAVMKWMVPFAGTEAQAWAALTAALGLQDLRTGLTCTAAAGAPALGGVVEYTSLSPNDALLRVDKPAPGIAALGTVDFGGQVMVALNFYLYGDQAAAVAATETPHWDAWFQQHFPPAAK